MSFIIDKIIDKSVIFIKLTDTGRDLASRGELNFNSFAIGDSEIDYNYIRENNNIDAEALSILRPNDVEPKIISHILKTSDSEEVLPLSKPIDNIIFTQTRKEEPRGVFNTETNQYFNDSLHVKQPDAAVENLNVTGGKSLTLKKADSYGANITEPEVGDYLFIKWANPDYNGQLGNNLGGENKIVQLTYKIISKGSGTLGNNFDGLDVVVDRELPHFNGVTNRENSRVFIYPNNNQRDGLGDAIATYFGAPFVTDYLSEDVISFQKNFKDPIIDVKVWNMSIIYTREIEGVQKFNQSYGQLPTAGFNGFVRYVERLDPVVENIGVIHYSNLSPANTYGEQFYTDENSIDKLPRLTIPHVMWYNDTEDTARLELKPEYVEREILELGTPYFNLVDNGGSNGLGQKIVGKIFPDLKIFVIEDQELLAALTYKSNRNYTLPPATGAFNLEPCDVPSASTTLPI